MLEATPAVVRVHYTDIDGPRTFVGAVAATQPDGRIALVANHAAFADPGVCCWQVPYDLVTRIEVLVAGHEPTVMEQVVAAVELTPRERQVYDALAATGGPVLWTHVAEIIALDHDIALEPSTVLNVIQALKAKGRVTVESLPGMTPGLVHVN